MLLDIVSTLQNADRSLFPNGGDYYARYAALKEYLNTNVHNNVTLGAIAKDGGLLNDHGPSHIMTVISRASDMLSGSNPMATFTPYEIYLLLCAIHFHDVGNVFGREHHEQRHIEVMKEVKPLLGADSTEIRCIATIACAHCGKIDGDQDTIGLLENDPVNGKDVRVQSLAAVLRFADELADDKHRAKRYLLEKNLIPEESAVFHKYATCLDSVMVRPDDGCVDLRFCLSSADVTRQWGKKAGNKVENVYIVDEIYARTLKMHLERTYCSRFIRSFVDITHISVKIEIFDEPDSFFLPRKKIEYRLEEQGYPSTPKDDIHSMCRNLQKGQHLAKDFADGKA